MGKSKTPVRFTGQHFTINNHLITDAIRLADINSTDTVIDIGAGKGHLTIQLAPICNKVIAIEKDRELARLLSNRFKDVQNVDVVNCDFRNFDFPGMPFKTVSNIPYAITSDILKYLMFQQANPFGGGTMVTQLEAAEKLFSTELFNPYTILYHSYFDMNLIRELSPDHFMPPPTVMSALVHIRKKQYPKVPHSVREKYLSFLFYFLRKPHMRTRTALKRLFRKRQVRDIVEKYGLNPNSGITRLTPDEWASCFRELLELVPEKYHPR
ncbi:MAG: 23S ribosomal RNA methyltransferase Erm [Balneolaceae bacterium]